MPTVIIRNTSDKSCYFKDLRILPNGLISVNLQKSKKYRIKSHHGHDMSFRLTSHGDVEHLSKGLIKDELPINIVSYKSVGNGTGYLWAESDINSVYRSNRNLLIV